MKKLIQKVFQTWQNQFTVSFIYLYQLLNYYDWSSFIRVQVQENDSGKEEDILFDIAHKLKKILESRTQVIEICNQKSIDSKKNFCLNLILRPVISTRILWLMSYWFCGTNSRARFSEFKQAPKTTFSMSQNWKTFQK